jgi:hypothetical protein
MLGAGLAALVYGFTALPRVTYPYDLDFVENGMVMQALRHAQGQPVFIAPSGEFAPNVYMPLYSWLGGLLFQLFGPGYTPLRTLSLVATLATAGLIFFITQRESQQRWVAWACAGLYLGGYRLSGFWYELIRVDSLYVALVLAAFTLAIYAGHKPRGGVLAAGVLALAFFTKQTAVVLSLILLPYFGRRAILFGLSFITLALGTYGLLNWLTEGWLYFHTFGIATGEKILVERVMHYIFADVLGVMSSLSALMFATIYLTFRRTAQFNIFRVQPWWYGVAGGILVSGLGRAPEGGNLNNLMLVYAFLCLIPGLLAREIWRERQRAPRWAEAALTGAILAQLALGAYNPFRYIPTPAMRAQGEALIAHLHTEPGPVLVLMHPYYAVLAGKEPATQIIHLWYFYTFQGLELPEDLASRIRNQYYVAIYSDESLFETEPAFAEFFRAYYPKVEPVPESAAPTTLSGWPTRPTLILRP